VVAGPLIHLPAGREHAFWVMPDRAHSYVLIAPAGFETFFPATGTVLDQPFEGELPVWDRCPPSELQAAHTAGLERHRPTAVRPVLRAQGT